MRFTILSLPRQLSSSFPRPQLSFPRRRESSPVEKLLNYGYVINERSKLGKLLYLVRFNVELDPRLRGDDNQRTWMTEDGDDNQGAI